MNVQDWHLQQFNEEQMKFAREIGLAAGVNIANRYYGITIAEQKVKCAYCRTPRMSMHKECKGCGASEVRAWG